VTAKSLVSNISDTARWVAYFRARETERPDALFRDPYASRLAGKTSFEIAHSLPDGNKHEWGWVARTYLFDQFVSREIQTGVDVVLNLAAGLDARPYRMDLPHELYWMEVDLPEILLHKEQVLGGEEPRCRLKRIALNLLDRKARLDLFKEANDRGRRVLAITEGLLLYFTNEEVASLARDLAAFPRFQHWVIDLASPGQLKLMQRTTGKQLAEAGASFKFGPPEGPDFFLPYGWAQSEVQGLLKTAATFNRLPAHLLAFLPEPMGLPGNYPWTGVCLLKKI
jgi:methyltransferase (TIGR00027 family)